MSKALPVHIADLSHHNASVDLGRAKKAGLLGLYHKATQGKGYVDPKYAARRASAKQYSLPFGGYGFAETTSAAVIQARHFIAKASPKPGDLRPVLDLEDYPDGRSFFSRMSLKDRTAWVGNWVDVVVELAGVHPLIYTTMDLADRFDCRLWVPRYNDDNRAPKIPKPFHDYTLWQFTDGQDGNPDSYPGLGHCDLNTFNPKSGTVKEMLAWLTIPQSVKKPPVKKPAPKPKTTTKVQFLLAPGKSTPNMARTSVKADGKETGQYCTTASIVGITEAVGTDTADFGAGLPKGFKVANPKTECPFWYGPDWTLKESHVVRLHGGLAHISPARIASCGTLENRHTGLDIGVIFTHLVSEAWNNETNSRETWRREMWNLSWPKIVSEAAKYTKAGLQVAVLGDLNTGPKKPGDSLRLAPNQIHAYSTRLDHVFLIPKGATITSKVKTIDIHSDHHLAIVSAGITK